MKFDSVTAVGSNDLYKKSNYLYDKENLNPLAGMVVP